MGPGGARFSGSEGSGARGGNLRSLQEKRHPADDDLAASFPRREVEDLLERVTEALDRWRALEGREPVLAGLFPLALPFGERIRR